ncbi:MAG: DUF4243 domain-containing protein [Pseudomonadales bacterium]|nr:DUF4243 domain-containing protein [Pseudomonadales bacterium]
MESLSLPEAVQALLKDSAGYHPEYPPDGNSDHLPMALLAMHSLGAPQTVLTAFRQSYSQRLVPMTNPADTAILRLNQEYQHEVEMLGIDQLVARRLPPLLSSLTRGAFHPLIRLGYGIEFDLPGEVAAALAYLHWLHNQAETTGLMPDVVPTLIPTREDLRDFLLAQVQRGAPELAGQRFDARLTALEQQGLMPGIQAENFDECARVALDVYLSTRNFFALHMVTATWAARQCAMLLEQPESCLAALSSGLAAAHLILGAPSFHPEQVQAAPAGLDEEHLFKYLFVCRQEYAGTGDQRYPAEFQRFAATGRVPDWLTGIA